MTQLGIGNNKEANVRNLRSDSLLSAFEISVRHIARRITHIYAPIATFILRSERNVLHAFYSRNDEWSQNDKASQRINDALRFQLANSSRNLFMRVVRLLRVEQFGFISNKFILILSLCARHISIYLPCLLIWQISAIRASYCSQRFTPLTNS